MAQKTGKQEVPVISNGQVIKEALKERGMMQVDLADRLGVLQSSISTSINRKHLGLDVFTKLLDAMDFDVAAVDRKTGEVMWKVEVK